MSFSWNRIADWIGLGEPAETEDLVSAAGLAEARGESEIRYSPQLISRLHGDHASLIELYQAVVARLAARRFEELPAALGQFKSKFDVHVLNENLRFYCYLEQKLHDRPSDLALIKEFRREMNGIARGVVNFIRKYQAAGVSAENQQTFATELQHVGALLVQRIQREESDLYPLYEA